MSETAARSANGAATQRRIRSTKGAAPSQPRATPWECHAPRDSGLKARDRSHLQSVFTQRGPGWVEKRFDEVCAITSTLVDPRKNEFLDLTHVGAGNIESKTGVFVDLKTAREERLISGKFLFDESMVLYSKIRPYLMKVARPDFEGLCSAAMASSIACYKEA